MYAADRAARGLLSVPAGKDLIPGRITPCRNASRSLLCPSAQIAAIGGADGLSLGDDVADDRVPERPAGGPGHDPADVLRGLEAVVLLDTEQVAERLVGSAHRVR